MRYRLQPAYCRSILLRWLAFAAVLCVVPVPMATQTTQGIRVQSGLVHFRAPIPLRVRPNLVCALCYLTVSATPTAVNFTLTKGGVATASAPIVITTTLYGVSALSSLTLYGYFSSSTAALTDGRATPDNIPSSDVLGEVPTGTPTSYTPFTQSDAVGTAGATLQLFSTSTLLGVGCIPSNAFCRTDSLSLEITLASLPQLPAGTYTGTLILQAQAL